MAKGTICRRCDQPGQWVRQPTAVGWVVFVLCLACDRASSPWARTDLERRGRHLEDLPVWDPHQTRRLRCQVCGRHGPTARHHLAPRAAFGDAADSWPVVEVCGLCHDDWHIVTRCPPHYRRANRAQLEDLYELLELFTVLGPADYPVPLVEVER